MISLARQISHAIIGSTSTWCVAGHANCIRICSSVIFSAIGKGQLLQRLDCPTRENAKVRNSRIPDTHSLHTAIASLATGMINVRADVSAIETVHSMRLKPVAEMLNQIQCVCISGRLVVSLTNILADKHTRLKDGLKHANSKPSWGRESFNRKSNPRSSVDLLALMIIQITCTLIAAFISHP